MAPALNTCGTKFTLNEKKPRTCTRKNAPNHFADK